MSEDFLNKQDEAFWAETPVEALGPILNAIGVAVFVIDIEEDDIYRIAFINRFYESSFRVSAAASVGLDVRSALSPDAAAGVIANYRRCIASGTAEKYDEEILLPSGLFYARTVLTPLHDSAGRINRIIGTTIDITDRRAMEVELEKARDHADDANKAKSSFMANMSHELRTPLNAVIGYSDLMRSETFGPLGHKKYGEYAEDIRFAGQHLLDIVNDILDLARVESGHIQSMQEMVSVSHLVESAVTLAQAGRKPGSAEITIGQTLEGVSLLVDRKQIRQCLINLLVNSSKFTEARGIVHIYSELLDDGRLAFVVSDTGRGIAPENLAKALAPFGRIDSEMDATTQGAGLGLPITKAFIEQHGGELHVNSMPGVGTTVFLILPRARVMLSERRPADLARFTGSRTFSLGGINLEDISLDGADAAIGEMPTGSFLLSESGTILRYHGIGDMNGHREAGGLSGRNFFSEVAPFRVTEEFRTRFSEAGSGAPHSHVMSKVLNLRRQWKLLFEFRPDPEPGHAWLFLRIH